MSDRLPSQFPGEVWAAHLLRRNTREDPNWGASIRRESGHSKLDQYDVHWLVRSNEYAWSDSKLRLEGFPPQTVLASTTAPSHRPIRHLASGHLASQFRQSKSGTASSRYPSFKTMIGWAQATNSPCYTLVIKGTDFWSLCEPTTSTSACTICQNFATFVTAVSAGTPMTTGPVCARTLNHLPSAPKLNAM